MTKIKSLSEWQTETPQVELSEFFLEEKHYSELYWEAKDLFSLSSEEKILRKIDPEKIFLAPIEQLSPKGIALMLHLYAQKDKDPRQPLIASTKIDLQKIVILMDNAAIGTEITVIFQPTDAVQGFLVVHKTVFTIKKIEHGLQILNMESGGGPYAYFGWKYINEALEQNAKALDRKITSCFRAMQKESEKHEVGKRKIFPEYFSRQTNGYECGVFAIKDARQINRDPSFLDKVMKTALHQESALPQQIEKKPKTEVEAKTDLECELFPADSDSIDLNTDFIKYELPPEYLKGMQSNAYESYVLPMYGDKVVNRKGKTLADIREKHRNAYIQHFSQKFHDKVEMYVRQHQDSIDIKALVAQYDAGKINAQELEYRYGRPKKPSSP